MPEEARVLLGVCGLYCGACYHYRASFYDQERLSREAARRGRDPDGFTCRGCRSDKLYIHAGCSNCTIRDCAEERGILHCGLCAEFPCERLKAFQSDGRVHHQDILFALQDLCDKGADPWLAEQAQRWKCTCGDSFSWYEERCNKCGKPLASYGADPTLKES